MQHFSRNSFLIFILLAACALAIIPPKEKLRKGRDLAGAVSLTYAVHLEPGVAADEAINNTIEVLRNRVDPNGLFEISFSRVGRDRIEISMPLPGANVKKLRAAYEQELKALGTKSITEEKLNTALREPAEAREAQLTALAGGDEDHLELLLQTATAWDALQSTRQAYLDAEAAAKAAEAAAKQQAADKAAKEKAAKEKAAAGEPANDTNASGASDAGASPETPTTTDETPAVKLADAQANKDASSDNGQSEENAVPQGPTKDELAALLDAVGKAEDTFAQRKSEVLALAIDPDELRRAIELPDIERNLLDRGSGDVVTLPSPRKTAIEAIKKAHPESVAEIDRVLDLYLAYEAQRHGFDDPRDLKRLLRGAGVLSFRIALAPGEAPNEQQLRKELADRGVRGGVDAGMRWFQIQDISQWYQDAQQLQLLRDNPIVFFQNRNLIGAERNGVYFILLWDTPEKRLTRLEGDWALTSASRGVDQLGKPAVNFRMDPRGAPMLGALTGANVNKSMAVLLDDKVYTAPNLLGRISRTGQIMGNFTPDDINYVVRTLSAGSLQARLSPDPISEVTLAPTLGADNLRSGLRAGVISLVAVAGFMAFYYLGTGLIAVVALFANAIMILGIMSLARAAFTLPGIAGIILTFGMAVDSNVLIYERIREEIGAGADLRTAVRLAYQKVLSTIVDANVTNLIVCLVLGYTATAEIRGFAITLGIGIVATLISALILTRLIFVLLIDRVGVRSMRQMPQVIPLLQRVLSPNINWPKLRPFFIGISTLYVGLGVVMIFHQGSQMLDTELRGGTQMTIQLRRENPDDPASPRVTLTRQVVEDRVEQVGRDDAASSPLADLRNAQVVAIDPQADQITSDRFMIKTVVAEPGARDKAVNAIVSALRDVIDSQPPLRFHDFDQEQAPVAEGVVARVTDAKLGGNFDRADLPAIDVSDYVGGVAILLDDIDPPVTLESLKTRLSQTRGQPPFSETALGRTATIIPIAGSDSAVRAAVALSLDPSITFFTDDARWRLEVAQVEWSLVRESLTNATTLASVQSFSPSIAQTLRAQAVVAITFSLVGILIYIWLRFGSLRYSVAAIVALLHDVLTVIGLVAVAEILYNFMPRFTGALLIEPFKINLALIAALLTIIGYSLNDTIVILDRIRENRGRLAYASADVINRSINQTISRTLITSLTTFLAILIMYIWGGQGLRAFTYAMLCGVVVGTYSSIAVAAPLVYSKKGPSGAAAGKSGAGADAKEALVAA